MPYYLQYTMLTAACQPLNKTKLKIFFHALGRPGIAGRIDRPQAAASPATADLINLSLSRKMFLFMKEP